VHRKFRRHQTLCMGFFVCIRPALHHHSCTNSVRPQQVCRAESDCEQQLPSFRIEVPIPLVSHKQCVMGCLLPR
jgi:hypothetical protein